jgi:hypothetical protein
VMEFDSNVEDELCFGVIPDATTVAFGGGA